MTYMYGELPERIDRYKEIWKMNLVILRSSKTLLLLLRDLRLIFTGGSVKYDR